MLREIACKIATEISTACSDLMGNRNLRDYSTWRKHWSVVAGSRTAFPHRVAFFYNPAGDADERRVKLRLANDLAPRNPIPGRATCGRLADPPVSRVAQRRAAALSPPNTLGASEKRPPCARLETAK